MFPEFKPRKRWYAQSIPTYKGLELIHPSAIKGRIQGVKKTIILPPFTTDTFFPEPVSEFGYFALVSEDVITQFADHDYLELHLMLPFMNVTEFMGNVRYLKKELDGCAI